MAVDTTVRVNSTQAQTNVQKLTKELNKATGSLDKLNATMEKLGQSTRKAKGENNKYSKSLSNLEQHARSSNKALLALEASSKAVSNIWRVILGYQIGKNLLQSAASIEATAQKVDLLNKKLTVLTGEAHAFDVVKMTAFDAGIAMDTLGAVVGRFAIASRGAFSTEEMTKWAETLVLSGRAAGTTAKEIDSTLLQLSQAFSSGNLMGEELRAIRENAPLYLKSLREVADESGFVGKTIKDMGADSEIGMNMMVAAFGKLEEKVAKFEGLTDTLQAATTRMNDQWQLLVNEMYSGQNVFTDLANTAAGFLIYIREDVEMITAFEKKFPQLSKAVKGSVEAFKLLLVPLKAVANGVQLTFEAMTWFIDQLGAVNTAAIAVTYALHSFAGSALQARLAVISLTSGTALLSGALAGLLGWEIGKYLREEFVEVRVAAIYALEAVLLAGAELEKGFTVIWANIRHSFDLLIDGITIGLGAVVGGVVDLIDSVPDNFNPISKESITNMRGFADSLMSGTGAYGRLAAEVGAAELKLEKSKLQIVSTTQEMREYELAVENTNKKIKEQAFLYDTSDVETDKYKVKLEALRKELDKNYAATSEYESKMSDLWGMYEAGVINLEEFNKLEALLVDQRESAINKANKLTKAEKALEKQRKDGIKMLSKYHDSTVALKEELEDLEDKVTLDADVSEQYDRLGDQVSKLVAIYSTGAMSIDEFNSAMKFQAELTEKIVAQKQENYLRDIIHTYDEVAKATYDYGRAEEELNKLYEAGHITIDLKNKKLLELQRNLLEIKAINDELSEDQQMWEGMRQGLYAYAEESASTFEMMADATENAFSGMTDEITNFVRTGEADFEGLVDSIIDDLTRIAIQKSITEPLAGMLFGASGEGEVSNGGGMLGGALSFLSGGSSAGGDDDKSTSMSLMGNKGECDPCSQFEMLSNSFSTDIANSFGDITEDVGVSFASMTSDISKDFTGVLGEMDMGLSQLFSGIDFGGMFGGSSGGGGEFDLLGSAMGFLGFKNGGAFNNGHLTAFANGGIVNSPTLFPMANGAGLMGEDGPEAIIPLDRKNGKLGIAGGGGDTINITINVHGTGGDPDAMNKSASQIAQAAGNATVRARRRNG